MSKIAIISQAEQGVLIDISGCASLTEAKQYLMSTLQVSSHFWEGLVVDLNLGPLVLTPDQVNEIQAIVSEVGVQPRQIFSLSPITRSSLIQCRLPLGAGQFPSSGASKSAENPFLKQDQPIAQAETEHSSFAHDASGSAAQSSAGGIATSIVELSNWTDEYVQETTAHVPLEASSIPTPERAAALPNLWLAARAGNSDSLLVAETIANAPVLSTTVIKAKTADASAPQKNSSPAVLMMKQNLRSGQSVCHSGHLVIIGDVNPGAELVADGDITVWGALRGMAHAGANGNTNAEIRALKFEPIQLRIAQAIARSPDRSKAGGFTSSGPETARIVDGKIRISGNEPE